MSTVFLHCVTKLCRPDDCILLMPVIPFHKSAKPCQPGLTCCDTPVRSVGGGAGVTWRAPRQERRGTLSSPQGPSSPGAVRMQDSKTSFAHLSANLWLGGADSVLSHHVVGAEQVCHQIQNSRRNQAPNSRKCISIITDGILSSNAKFKNEAAQGCSSQTSSHNTRAALADHLQRERTERISADIWNKNQAGIILARKSISSQNCIHRQTMP